MADRERTWTLFGFVICWLLWQLYDGSQTAGRRDREIAKLREVTSAARERAQGAEEANKRRAEGENKRLTVLGLALSLVLLLITAIAYHVI